MLAILVAVLLAAAVAIGWMRDASRRLSKAADRAANQVPSPAPTLPPATGVPDDGLTAEQRQAVDQLKAEVSQIRGLPWKKDLPIRVVSKAELARRVRDLNAQDTAKHPERVRADEATLKLLRLIPQDVDYAKLLDDVLAGGVLGFYDDEAKELYVGGDTAGALDPATRSTLAHELTHALTDQTFDFESKSKALDDAHLTEESAAFSAVIEGDAELVRETWEKAHLSSSERLEAQLGGTADGGVYDGVPPYLLDALFFPYQDGKAFVESRVKAGGFAEVDKAYQRPPVSTEQILHPALYAAGQGWTAPPLPDLAAASGCSKVDDGTLGEFDMAELLAPQVGRSVADQAAAGWNGDAFTVVRCGSALGLGDRWRTDTNADATALTEALARWARTWAGSSRAPDADGRFSGPSGAGRLVRAGDRVDLVLAQDAATADRVVRAMS
jgi:hypothetical protein